MSDERPTTSGGFGRLLVSVYGILALAALGRSSYQVLTKLAEAPAAYLLSLVAAVVYVVATVALALGGRGTGWRGVAWGAVVVEAAGVLTVGTLSVTHPEYFAEATVWSGFGQGYGYVPLVLPFVGLWWLWHTRPGRTAPESAPVRPTEA
ncbi:hypothetical protein [Isoptericola sediminis]|uniref:Integral membrane protein n=1 Tax=Isoptericola sediminis TaxID=2733572 RepID=A0A849JZ25_9MICO|nr:hypothetical protein [Isoptericola sediminis]